MTSEILLKITEIGQDAFDLINRIKKVDIPKDRPFLSRELSKIDDDLFSIAIKIKTVKCAIYNLNNAMQRIEKVNKNIANL